MSERSIDQNKMVVYMLAVVAVLLAVIVGLLVVQSRGGAPLSSNNNNSSVDTSAAAVAAAKNSPKPTESGPFDATKATKVPSGQTPEDYLKTYYEAVKKGDYKTAYDLLPVDKKASQDLASFTEQLKGYGISGYSLEKPTTKGDEQTILAYQDTASFGSFGTNWTFVKKDGGWLVKSKEMAGMK